MKKVLAVILAAIFVTVLFSLSASAEELKAPTVQFKLINYDETALRWNEVEGADYYQIYRTDVETGKTVKYKNPIKKTEVTIKGLSAETEYIFKVAAVSEKMARSLPRLSQEALTSQRLRNGTIAIRLLQTDIIGHTSISRRITVKQYIQILSLTILNLFMNLYTLKAGYIL